MGSTTTARRPVPLWGALLAVFAVHGCAAAWDAPTSPPEQEPRLARGAGDTPLHVQNPFLERRTHEIARRSATWRAAMDTLSGTRFWVVVGTPADIRRSVPGLENYRSRHLGEVVPLRDDEGALLGAIVTIDLELLEQLGARTGVTRAELEADVDRILVHEIYGHVVPLAWNRTIAGGCPDPAPGAPAESSCAMLRENRIRAELGMQPRLAYDLSGLSVGRALEASRLAAGAGASR
jgi:hypothetical protein